MVDVYALADFFYFIIPALRVYFCYTVLMRTKKFETPTFAVAFASIVLYQLLLKCYHFFHYFRYL